MQYKFMDYASTMEAIKNNTPVLIGIGNLEYHSGHLPVGTDGLIIEGCLERLEERHPDWVVMPMFYYGSSSYAVSGPETGTIHVDSMAVCRMAEELFTSLLQAGFKNIHGFAFHQTENFVQGMPLDLAFRFAGRRAIMAEQERKLGRGWWGRPEMKGYYDAPENNIFNYIRIHAIGNAEIDARYGSDHAGITETAAIMELYPHYVKFENRIHNDWFAEDADKATPELGKAFIKDIVDNMENLVLTP